MARQVLVSFLASSAHRFRGTSSIHEIPACAGAMIRACDDRLARTAGGQLSAPERYMMIVFGGGCDDTPLLGFRTDRTGALIKFSGRESDRDADWQPGL